MIKFNVLQRAPPPPPMMNERLQTEEHEMLIESLEPIPETPIMPARYVLT